MIPSSRSDIAKKCVVVSRELVGWLLGNNEKEFRFSNNARITPDASEKALGPALDWLTKIEPPTHLLYHAAGFPP